jgi:protein TonB
VIQPPKRLLHVDPVYPPVALAARKEGMVILEALIGEDGATRDVRVLRPAPQFEQAAIAAVRQWRFSPTLLNGEPVPVVMTVTVSFNLTR